MELVKDWADVFKNVLGGIAILGAATWTIFRFGIFRERFAKIEFNVDCRYIGSTTDSHILELMAIIENKGLVRQYIKKWTFDLLLFKKGDVVDESREKINYQVNFAIKKISQRPWVPTLWEDTFIDAGTKQVYTYLTAVPKEIQFISLYTKFIYPNIEDFHSAQKTFNIETLTQASVQKA